MRDHAYASPSNCQELPKQTSFPPANRDGHPACQGPNRGADYAGSVDNAGPKLCLVCIPSELRLEYFRGRRIACQGPAGLPGANAQRERIQVQEQQIRLEQIVA